MRELIRDGRYARAAECVETALATIGSCTEERVELLTLGAEAWRRGNRKLSPETLARNREAVDLAGELYGEDDSRCAEPLLQLGILHALRGDYPAASNLLQRSLRIVRDASGGKDVRQATTLIYLAYARFRMDNDVGRASATLDEADKTLDRLDSVESTDRAWIHEMRGTVFALLARDEQALVEFRASLEIRRRIQRSTHPSLVIALVQVATVENRLGHLAKARDDYEEILALLREGVEVSWTLVDVLAKFGGICRQLQDFPRAQAAFEDALAELNGSGQENSEVGAETLQFLAHLARQRKDFDGARDLAARGLAVLDATTGADPSRRGDLELLSAQLEIDGDRPDWSRAEELAAKAASHGIAAASEVLAWVAAARGDPQRARDLLFQLSNELRLPGGEAARDLPKVLSDLSRADFALGDLGRALSESLEAEALARELWEEWALGLEEVSALGLESAGSFGGIVHPAVCAASHLGRGEASERVWDALLLSRDRVFRECEERLALARDATTAEGVLARERLARARQTLAGLYVKSQRSDRPESFRAAVDRARIVRDLRERELWSTVRVDGGEPRRVTTLRDLAPGLEKGAGLVRYCLAERPTAGNGRSCCFDWQPWYYACVLGSEGSEPSILEIGPRSEIDRQVGEFLRAVRGDAKASDVTAQGAVLRRRILDPVLGVVRNARLVFLVPEGELCRLPFLALANDDGSFLAEEGPLLHVLGSEEDLVRPAMPAGRGMLALGDPWFGDPDVADEALALAELRTDSKREGANALPRSRSEIEAIDGFWRRGRFAAEDCRLLLGPEATESSFRRLAPGRRVLHLATHGYFESDAIHGGADRGSGFHGARVPIPPPDTDPKPYPSLRSGLLFASGARGNADDDGILTSEEAVGLDLRGVEWVVLSACDTGVGDIQPFEGVLGLQRAMRLAGARTVIASLWPVEDEWAREWMEALYRARLERGLGTAEAVRAACVEVIRRARDAKEEALPRRWASFIAVGDWR